MKITAKRAGAAAAALGAICLVAGSALALDGTADEVIHACRHPNGGWIRIPAQDGTCRQREQAVAWNVQGPKGDPGPAGPPGPKGDPGAGLTRLEDLRGIPCTTDGGGTGAVALDLAGDDTVMLRCLGEAGPPPAGESTLVVNEIDYDQVGTDADGFVEIENVGAEAADLTGIALVFVDGGASTEYRREALEGSLAPGGFLVVSSDAQNGSPDGVALLDTTSGALLDALSYEGAIESAQIGATTYDLVEGTVLPASVADSNTVEGSLIRNPDGRDANDAASDWAFTTTVTRGAANVHTAP